MNVAEPILRRVKPFEKRLTVTKILKQFLTVSLEIMKIIGSYGFNLNIDKTLFQTIPPHFIYQNKLL